MPPKDYYLVLGIPPGESAEGVRRAFRDLARRHHPDRAGPAGAPRFRELLEAYQVLSDPVRRDAYDAGLRERATVRTGHRPRAGRGRPLSPVSLFAAPESVRPGPEALLDRLVRSFLGRDVEKSGRREPLLCDIALSPEEARRGGVLPIRIPVREPCRVCRGARHVDGFACPRCDARGEVAAERVVRLEIPAGVRPGTVLELPLDAWGIAHLWLRARIGVLA